MSDVVGSSTGVGAGILFVGAGVGCGFPGLCDVSLAVGLRSSVWAES